LGDINNLSQAGHVYFHRPRQLPLFLQKNASKVRSGKLGDNAALRRRADVSKKSFSASASPFWLWERKAGKTRRALSSAAPFIEED
jgi:hypothetical protein